MIGSAFRPPLRFATDAQQHTCILHWANRHFAPHAYAGGGGNTLKGPSPLVFVLLHLHETILCLPQANLLLGPRSSC